MGFFLGSRIGCCDHQLRFERVDQRLVQQGGVRQDEVLGGPRQRVQRPRRETGGASPGSQCKLKALLKIMELFLLFCFCFSRTAQSPPLVLT